MKTMKKSVWDNYRKAFTPTLSDEVIVRVFFQMMSAFLLMRIHEYESAIKQYETIINNYKTSPLAESAKYQVAVCKDIIEGRLELEPLIEEMEKMRN